MKIFVTHSSDINVHEDLYKPIRESHFNFEHEIKLPQETGKETITKELIQAQDLIIAESSMPSTGSGIELGWADMYGVPIINIYRKDSKSSSSMRYVTDKHIEYTNNKDMVNKLAEFIKEIS